ncbi:helix-turn-helix transcriptional regulator [Catellatospora sp. NPDC049133]|uniref:helix-turn-helix transcriptional regulator n=1 Tax=Catellatospora sp. NPDC049133 TaxID=3155499 RepID=UPI0033DADE38
MPDQRTVPDQGRAESAVPDQPAFGRQLRALRQQRGLSQAELVGTALSTAYLSRLESGQRPPTTKVIKLLAERLGVPTDAFAVAPPQGLGEVVAKAASAPRPEDAVPALRQALAEATAADAGSRWHALWLLAEIHTRRLERTEALAVLRRLVALGDDIGDPELRVRARNRLALCHRSLGEIPAAYAVAQQALALADEQPVPADDAARTLLTLISVEAELGRLPDARAHADDLRALTADRTGTLPVEALWTAATVRIRQGDDAAALELLHQALHRLDSHDDLVLWLRLRLAAASLCLQMTPRQVEEAAARLDEVRPAVALVGTPLHNQEFLLLSAQLAYQQGRDEAAEAASAGLEPTEHLLTFRDRVRLHLLRNQLLLRRGESATALANLRDLARQAHEAANIDLAAEIWRTIAEAPHQPAP